MRKVDNAWWWTDGHTHRGQPKLVAVELPMDFDADRLLRLAATLESAAASITLAAAIVKAPRNVA